EAASQDDASADIAESSDLISREVLFVEQLQDRVEYLVRQLRVGVLLTWPMLRGRRALDHPLRNHAAEGVPVAREAVHQELAAVLDGREAAGHVAVERRIAHGHLALVAGGEEHPPGLVRDPHEQQHAAARLDVLLRGVLRATRELALERRERALEHSL